MNIDTTKLETITLKHGAHRSFEEGACAMEAVAWLAGEPHSDHPACACPVIAAFVRRMNDRLHDEERTRLLRPLLTVLIGTRSEDREVMQRRAYIAANWAVRTSTPMLLRALGREEWATRLEGLAEIVDRETSLAARDVARDVAREVRAATSVADAAYAAYDAAYADAAYAADAAYTSAASAAYAAYDAYVAYAAYDADADAAYAAYASYAADDAVYAVYAAYAADAAAAAKANLDSVRDTLNASAVEMIRHMCEVGR